MTLVMVTLGGATRLTGSGLSIMEWAPLMGTLPPLSDLEWHRLYNLYQKTSQYQIINQGFGISGFKEIFWLEWAHRLCGRLLGLILIIPLLWFALRRQLEQDLMRRLFGLVLLGALQGGVGWFMVASGFEADRTAVSPYRLVMHLTLAIALYTALLWTALGVLRRAGGRPTGQSTTALRRLTIIAAAFLMITILAGGFVAGLHAGLTYNTFPLMDGQLIPDGYGSLKPFTLNLFENIGAVQFNHRLLATITGSLALSAALLGIVQASGAVRLAMVTLGFLVVTQYVLGIATLLWSVPVALGTAHQALAMLALSAAVIAIHMQTGHNPRLTHQPAPLKRHLKASPRSHLM